MQPLRAAWVTVGISPKDQLANHYVIWFVSYGGLDALLLLPFEMGLARVEASLRMAKPQATAFGHVPSPNGPPI